MKNDEVVSINGRPYDQKTGLPLRSIVSKPMDIASKPIANGARAMHSGLQKSQTLMRKAAKKPEVLGRPISGRSMDIAKSARISRFSKHPVALDTVAEKTSADVHHTPHPMVKNVREKIDSKPLTAKTMAELKKDEIKKAVESTTAKPDKKLKVKKERKHSVKKYVVFTVAVIALIGASIYAYTVVPDISIRIAASQAGVNATYPGFTPEGFSFDGPITADSSSVVIRYKETDGKNYTLKQTTTNWDSSAVEEKMAKTWQNGSYSTIQSNGLNIYTSASYDKVAWVNHGILYTLTSSADLNADKVKRIALSM